MKWAVFITVLVTAWPLGKLLRGRDRMLSAMVWLMGLLPFLGLPRVTMNPISYELYRGDARGMEVTLVDILALLLLFALPARRHPLPYWRTSLLYVAIVAISMISAPMPHYAFFGLWKALRLVLYVFVLARAFEDWRLGARWLNGIAWGTLFALLVALQQRYLQHEYQIPSTFPHQNTLGMAMALLAPVVFSILLAGQGGRLAWATLLTMAVLLVLGLSRGAMVAFVLGTGLAYLASLGRGLTRTKIYVALASLAGAIVLVIKSHATIVERFLRAPEASARARDYFEGAAATMLQKHPFGVGINQFSYMLEHGAYANPVAEYDRTGLVHNLYWLTLAELGYPGFVAFVLLMAVPLVIAVRGAWRARGDIRGDILAGCAAGMVALYAHSLLEWVARQTVMGYLYWGVAALVYSLSRETARGAFATEPFEQAEPDRQAA